jgi:hypothetical protein
MMADSIEERILEIIMRKQGYHDSLFKPIAGAQCERPPHQGRLPLHLDGIALLY